MGTVFIDYNNDRSLDIFLAKGQFYPQAKQVGNSYIQHNMLVPNLRNGRFAIIPEREGVTQGLSSHGTALASS